MRPLHLALPLSAAVSLAGCSDSGPPPVPVTLVPPVGVSTPETTASPLAPEAAPVARTTPKPTPPTERDLYDRMAARAQQGDVEARFEVAMMHLLGKGGAEKDRGLALEMLKRAADDGSQRAAINLANLLIESDREQALRLYEKAGEAGDIDALRHAAFLLAYETDGSTPTQDTARLEKAQNYLKDAAAKGDLFAEALLGKLLLDLGQTQEAVRRLKKPALAGVSGAMESVLILATTAPDAVDKALLAKLKTIR
ncbi:hypothetical protein Atep_31250 (plasmid) [Allochromatium tepidum]|uniref:Sel1 repeat family protein n=2 Tax=Allochromatium tepidum TaxID=553982 RepID=A0ABN6GGH5_9GAMM|nr:hypothetical protein Atep_31250 [Allochromatium tepidum]